MNFRIALEWSEGCGISLSQMYPFREGIEEYMHLQNYGIDISFIWIVLVCRPRDFKQRKRYKKNDLRFEYDILLDFFLIKNIGLEEKKVLIREQVIETTIQTLSKYKFQQFD